MESDEKTVGAMSRIILVRHGHVEGIAPERFRGRWDVPLSPLGRLQAQQTALTIAERWRVDAVLTSPMGRCIETGRVIAERVGETAAPLDSLNDLDYGEWQWLTHEEARAASPELFARWFSAPELMRFPGGESLQDLVARAADALRRIEGLYPAHTVVVVAHDSVNRAILLQALGQPLSAYWRLTQSPCGISELQIDGERFRVMRMNETAHIDTLED